MDSARLTYLFHRYVNNNCTTAEKAEFLTMVDDPQNEARLRELMDQLWMDVPGKKLHPERSKEILGGIFRKDEGARPLGKTAYFPWTRIAASVVLAIVCGGALFYYANRIAPGEAQSGRQEAAQPSPRFITLPDGSSVVLNAGSELDFPMEFTGSAREVSLTGEGYFDIAHDAQHPFVVHTGKLTTTVLGTAFNIRAYPDQADITVTVTRGKVKVSDDRKVLGIVNPDQQITFNTALDHTEQRVVNSRAVTAWIEKDIFFDDITIAQAIDQLEKRFGISVQLVNDSMSNCRFTATFVRGEDVEQILRIICDFNNATLSDSGAGSFVIEGGACPL